MKICLFLFLFIFPIVNAFPVCDNLGANCNVVTSLSFANVDSVTYVYTSPGPTIVDGVTYDVVIRWQPEAGAEITHSWTAIAESRRVNFDCTNSRMWFNGITVDATPGFTGSKNNIPTCTFNMQNGVLTSSYLASPGTTVFFLFSSITDIGDDLFIDKNFDFPIIPSDNYDPGANDVNMVCLDPNDAPNCNPDNSISFSGLPTSVQFTYPAATSTITTNAINYDYVVQWTPDPDTPITSSWQVAPERRQDPFDCTNSRLWLNGTIVDATLFFNGADPYCVFNMQDGVLSQAYIDAPGRTVFFLFSGITGVGDDLIIARNYEKAVVSSEFYVPPNEVVIPVCDDQNGPQCNVVLDISFADDTNPVSLTYDTAPGLTLSDGVTYDSAIKWVASPTETLEYSFRITPDRVQDPFDCSGARLWVNGTVVSATTFTTTSPPYCTFDIQDGVLPQSVIDSPYNNIYFLFNTLIGEADVFYISRDTDRPIVSIENFSPENLDSYVCDDPAGPNCNPIATVSFVDDSAPVGFNYDTTQGLTTVGGVDYEMVVKWVADPTEVLTYSWEVYPDRRQDFISCAGVRVWVNGTIVDTDSFLRGAQNNEPYCVYKIQNGVLSQDFIDNPSNKVFFLFNGLVANGDPIFIDKNTDTPVVSIESIVFYKFGVQTYTVTSNNQGSTITFDIEEIVYESPSWPGPDTQCNNGDTIMGSINVGSCTLNPTTSDTVNGIYTYDFPKTLYDFCSNGREDSGNNYIYTVVVGLTGEVGSCKYFSPDDRSQTSSIEIAQNQIDPGGGPQETVVTLELTSYDIIQCTPIDFIVPQAKSTFTVTYTFTGNEISLTEIPYLDELDDPLNIVSRTCTSFTDGTPNTCVYEFESTLCKPLLSVNGQPEDVCAFDGTDSKTLRELDVTQIIDEVNQISGTKEFPALPTALNLELFNGTICDTSLSNPNPVNVTEQYDSTMTVRNRPYPNFDVTPTKLNFYDDLIFRIEITDSVGGGQIELHIKSVIFDLFDPETGTQINRYTFNRGDKEVMHVNDWSRYYDDVHFCKYENQDGTCSPYYEVGSGRVNDFTELEILPQLFDICQTDFNTTISDHFSFNPAKWFRGLSVPTVDIKVTIFSEVIDCVQTPNRRLSETRSSTTFNFMAINKQFTTETANNRKFRYVKVVESGDLDNGSGTSFSDALLISGLLILLAVVGYFAFRNNFRRDNAYLIVR